MRKMMLGITLLLLDVPVFSSVPKDVPGEPVVRDQVVQALQRFRLETDRSKRIAWLKEFGRIHDPRVTVALMEVVLNTEDPGLLLIASYTMVHFHIPEKDWVPAKYWTVARLWRKENERDVRRRADALPK